MHNISYCLVYCLKEFRICHAIRWLNSYHTCDHRLAHTCRYLVTSTRVKIGKTRHCVILTLCYWTIIDVLSFILLDLNDYFFDSNIRFTYLHFVGLASFLENKSTTGENN